MDRKQQFSLAAIFIISTVASVLCALATIIGWEVVIGNLLVQGVFLIAALASQRPARKSTWWTAWMIPHHTVNAERYALAFLQNTSEKL